MENMPFFAANFNYRHLCIALIGLPKLAVYFSVSKSRVWRITCSLHKSISVFSNLMRPLHQEWPQGGLEGVAAPCRNILAPSQGEKLFYWRFVDQKYPNNSILALCSMSQPPFGKSLAPPLLYSIDYSTIDEISLNSENEGRGRHAGKIVGQGGPTGAKGHLLP